MSRKPIEIKRLDQGLKITWSDNAQAIIPSEVLRRNCPCAECLQARGLINHDRPIGGRNVEETRPSEIPPTSTVTRAKSRLNIVKNDLQTTVALEEIWAIGNYAIGVRWGDGHGSGIYSWSILDKLSAVET